MRPFRRAALPLVALAVMATLPACGSDDKPGDKRLTVYSGRLESLVKPILEQFQQASGITVEVRYGDSAAMAAQLLEEGQKSPADVFLSQDAPCLMSMGATRACSERPPWTLPDRRGPLKDHLRSLSWVCYGGGF